MGLDMYLEARKYVGRIDWNKVPKRGLNDDTPVDFNDYLNEDFVAVKEIFPPELTKHTESGSYVAVNVGYWRKANQIHGWFVREVQNGVDDCKEYSVSREKLEELRDTVTKVLEGDKNTARELLPVTEGFFFGNYDEEDGYDKWYEEQLFHTRDVLENILNTVAKDNIDYEFYYSSSW
jgi:hypothetical protein